MATKEERNQALQNAAPHKKEAVTREVTLKCSTGKGDAKVEHEFQAEMPETLADAIALEGVKDVFRRYLGSLAIELQGEQRQKLAPEGEQKERKRAKYLEELGV